MSNPFSLRVRYLKKKLYIYNILAVGIRGILACVIVYYVYMASSSFIFSFLSDFERYKDIRGIQNYGTSCIGTLVKNEGNNLSYRYIVDGKAYYKNIENIDGVSVDNKVELLYDILEPDLCILKSESNGIDNFYTNKFKDLGIIYIKIFCLVIVYSVLWYVLDVLRYKGRVKAIEGKK